MKKKQRVVFSMEWRGWRVNEESIGGIYLYMRREYLKGKRPGTCKESFFAFPSESEFCPCLAFRSHFQILKRGRRVWLRERGRCFVWTFEC